MDNSTDVISRLEVAINNFRQQRDTHILWRDCDPAIRRQHPSTGSREFHAEMVEAYDKNIAAVEDAISALKTPPVATPSSDQVLRKFFVTFIETVYPDLLAPGVSSTPKTTDMPADTIQLMKDIKKVLEYYATYSTYADYQRQEHSTLFKTPSPSHLIVDALNMLEHVDAWLERHQGDRVL